MNQQIFLALNSLAGRSLIFDDLVVFSAVYLGPLFLVFVFLREAFLKSDKWPIERNKLALLVLMIIGSFIIWIFAELINKIYPVTRPSLFLPQAVNLIGRAGTDSFPSGHTTFFFTLAFLFYKNYRNYFSAALIVAAIVSLSRVIGGIHWPTDITGGIAMAFLGAYLLNPLCAKIVNFFTPI